MSSYRIPVDMLRLLVEQLDTGLEEAGGSARWLLRLDEVNDIGGCIGFKPLDGHPLDVLRRFTAPREWYALGFAADGWSHAMTWLGAERRARERIRMIALATRDGTEIMAMRRYGHDDKLDFMPGLGEGPLADTLRRTVGLPTPPPDVTMAEFLAKAWLQLVIAAAKRNRRAAKLSWEQAAVLHPAMELIERPVTANNLGEAGAEIASRMDWERMRRETAKGGDVQAADARWMDAGMFARWQVNGRPPLDELLKRASHRLTPAAEARVHQTLAGWGLLEAPAA